MLSNTPLRPASEQDPSTSSVALVHGICALAGSERVALFRLAHTSWRLVWADRIAQDDLGVVDAVDGRRLDLLHAGTTLRTPAAAVLLPCRADSALVALLYLSPAPPPSVLPRHILPHIGELLALSLEPERGAAARGTAAVHDIDEPPLTLTSREAARDELVTLLESQEWNVARVARVLGVTRMTIYNRLRRHAIPRLKVLKSQKPRRRVRVAQQAASATSTHR